MKKAPRSIFLLAISITLIACSSEGQKQAKTNETESHDHSAHANMDMGSSEPTDESIYNVSSVWKNRHGKELELSSLRGKVQIVAMVYTHCEYACPRILADMKRIRDQLSGDALANANFVIISIDPERDTPERLNTFATENDLNEETWTLLNGDQGDVLEIAALLGVKYKRISPTDFTHSNMITVLNKEGEVIHQREKLADQQTETVEVIESLI
ncbi:SCO family protein [Aliifodinibius sp. S!AR15-10]|uniref:SCO family protein n=1 Tax=Aliifodinibius sp. S!AR15-10 TaxID=2950437 RepID=UPI00285B9A22|nr:SCO family protein [Aliifodinibius sp. S!AR15-10]MDR8393930.1 SCO family protein [Aliifodinibius sp. S!AR15-10]